MRISITPMKSNFKPSISSRASIRSLIVASLPATVLAYAANCPALEAAINSATNHDLTVDDNLNPATNAPTTNGASTNRSGASTNGDRPINYPISGIRG